MRKKIVAGNWKMNMTQASGRELYQSIAKAEVPAGTEVIIIPPFVYISDLHALTGGKPALGAQNCHPAASGAYTGEVSAAMVKDAGATYCLVGHSERRQYFGENDAFLKEKTDALLSNGLTPVFCCGETLEERESGREQEVVGAQLKNALFHLSTADIQKLILAYEPVWAIGTGKTASPEQAQEMHHFIRQTLAAQYGQVTADSISILYGGSVKADNARELFGQPDIDGGLIGGASLKADDFNAIIKATA